MVKKDSKNSKLIFWPKFDRNMHIRVQIRNLRLILSIIDIKNGHFSKWLNDTQKKLNNTQKKLNDT